ncbi:hypothetical protein [Pseudomonas sp. 210_17 TE3656]
MSELPFPCFFGIEEILQLNADDVTLESAHILIRLQECAPESRPFDSYALAKKFLQANAVSTRYSVFRSAVERLLLWCLLVVKKPVAEFDEVDIRCFMDFCLFPPDSWVASRPEKRLMRVSTKRNSRALTINPSWRPFRPSANKAEILYGDMKVSTPPSLAAVMAVINQFYLFLYSEDVISVNPAAQIHSSRQYASVHTPNEKMKIFERHEWNIFVSTAELLADGDPAFERKLFLMMTVYYLHLQPGEIDSFGSQILMKSLFQRADGTYGLDVALHPELKPIIIPSEYVERWVSRFRFYLGTHLIPLCRDPTPIISTQSGRGGISSRHANLIFKSVCCQVRANLEIRGVMVPDDSVFRKATLLWVRETSLMRLAESMPFDEFYPTIRGTTVDTIFARFYAWQPRYQDKWSGS